MTRSLPNPRYERKFTTPHAALGAVQALLGRHPAAFRQAYPPRTVNNIYLDSPRLHGYHDHVNGVARRVKTRVRWYGETNGLIPHPRLERKLKCGVVSGKQAQELPPFSLDGDRVRQAIERAFAGADLPAGWRAAVGLLEPTLFNCYRRQYLVSADGRFRLTVDTELRFGSPQASVTRGTVGVPLLVLELKFTPEDAEQAAWVTNRFPFRMVRCSKYVLGIECTAVSH